MPDRLALTPDALESLLSDASRETVASFVADLLRREGRATEGKNGAVERDGRVITASRGSGDQRLLVWTDGRGPIERALGSDPEVPEHEPVDAVVTRTRDAAAAGVVADRIGARVIDADELHDRLLYAIDRGSCRELCRTHFGVEVEPRSEPPIEATGGSDALASGLRTGHLLAAVALLGVVVAVAAGVPGAGDVAPVSGVGGPAGTATVPPAGSVGAAATPIGGPTPTPVGGVNPTSTPAGSDTPAPEGGATPTPTASESDAVRCEDCPTLLSVPDVDVEPGSRTTITSTVTNPHPGVARAIALRVTSPAAAVSVQPSWGRSIHTLGPNETRTVTWDLSVAASANGTYDLLVLSRHRHDGTTTYARAVGSVSVVAPPPEIPGECKDPCSVLGAEDGEVRAPASGTVTLDATLTNPYTVNLTSVETTVVPRTGWTASPSNGTRVDVLSPGSSRRLRWNVSVPASAAGEYGLTVRATFAGPEGEARRTVTVDYRVYVTGPPPGSDGVSPPEDKNVN